MGQNNKNTQRKAGNHSAHIRHNALQDVRVSPAKDDEDFFLQPSLAIMGCEFASQVATQTEHMRETFEQVEELMTQWGAAHGDVVRILVGARWVDPIAVVMAKGSRRNFGLEPEIAQLEARISEMFSLPALQFQIHLTTEDPEGIEEYFNKGKFKELYARSVTQSHR